MLKKIGNLFNIKNWVESFVFKMILNKGVKHAVSAIIGILAGAKIQAILTQYGVAIDIPHLQTELTVAFTGGAGALINWAQKTMDKDGDGELDWFQHRRSTDTVTTPDKPVSPSSDASK